MGENKKKKAIYNLRVDEDLLFAFKKVALDRRIPLNKLFTEVMLEYLEKYDELKWDADKYII